MGSPWSNWVEQARLELELNRVSLIPKLSVGEDPIFILICLLSTNGIVGVPINSIEIIISILLMGSPCHQLGVPFAHTHTLMLIT